MKVHVVSVVFGPARIFDISLQALMTTAGRGWDTYTIVDNHWPIDTEKNGKKLERIAASIGARFLRPPGGNIGGHQGFNYGTPETEPDDIVIGYDFDSFPVTHGWMDAIVRALNNSDFDAITMIHSDLYQQHQRDNSRCHVTMADGIRIGTYGHAELMNVGGVKASFLKRVGGLRGSGYYGNVETAMGGQWKTGYAIDYIETHHPIRGLQTYIDWKVAHAIQGYPHNFDVWLKDHPAT